MNTTGKMFNVLLILYFLNSAFRCAVGLKVLGTVELNPFIGAENALDQEFGLGDITVTKDSIASVNKENCQYGIRYAGSNTADSPHIIFAFRINQHNCLSNTTIGNAKFQSFLNSSNALATCSTVDLHDNNYVVLCALPTVSTTVVSSLHPLCADLAVVLVAEQFGGLDDISFSNNSPHQPVLLHRKSYCTHSMLYIGDSKASLASALHVVARTKTSLPKNVRWYSGQWVSVPPQSSATHSSPISSSGSLVYGRYTCELLLYTAGSESIIKQLGSHEWTVSHCLNSGFNYKHCNRTAEQNVHTHQSVANTIKHTHHRGNLEEKQYIRNVTHSDHQFHFLGGAHMREYFNYVRAYYLDTPSQSNNDENKIVVGNLRYQSASTTQQLSVKLPKLCDTLQNQTRHGDLARHTIIFQTGQVDATITPLRTLLYGSDGAADVLRKFEGIFNHTLLCGGLTRIVYITTRPFPTYNKDSPIALGGQVSPKFRANTAIKALNSYMTSNMLRVSESAYHIFKPHTTGRDKHRKLAHTAPSKINYLRENGRNNHGQINNALENKNREAYVRKKASLDPTSVAVKTPVSAQLPAERVKTVFPMNLVPVQLSVIDSYTMLQPLLNFNDRLFWAQGVERVQKLVLAALSIDRQYPNLK